MRAVFLAVLLAVLLAPVACANDPALGAVGGVLQPMDQHPSVMMLSEHIYIKLMPDRVAVDCRFHFTNTGDPVTVKMGFPEDHAGDSSGFEYFRSKVDGKPVKVERVRGEWRNEYEGRNWYVKDVSFGRRQSRIIEESYGGMAGAVSIGEIRFTSYVLTTGKPWLGKIGKAIVVVDTSAIRDHQTIRIAPKPQSREGDRLIWSAVNLEPEHDIHIRYWPGFSDLVIDGKDLSTDADFYIAEDGPIAVTVDEGRKRRVVVPRVEEGVLMAPARRLNWLLGVRAEPGTAPGSVVLSGGGTTMTVVAGSRTATVDGAPVSLPRAPYIRHGIIMVPVAAVGNALGASVRHEKSTGKIHIQRLEPSRGS